jgi:hypothetical protein
MAPRRCGNQRNITREGDIWFRPKCRAEKFPTYFLLSKQNGAAAKFKLGQLRGGFFGHSRESFLDAIEWNADKVGVPWLPPVGRPGSIMASRTCDIGDVVLGARYPPKVRISIMLADSKSHGTLLLLIDALRALVLRVEHGRPLSSEPSVPRQATLRKSIS